METVSIREINWRYNGELTGHWYIYIYCSNNILNIEYIGEDILFKYVKVQYSQL